MSETIGSCLDHPAKGSWSKSATWNTKKDSVGQSLKGAADHQQHIVKEKGLSFKKWGGIKAKKESLTNSIYHFNLNYAHMTQTTHSTKVTWWEEQ